MGDVNEDREAFVKASRGRFVSALRWQDLDRLWELLRTKADDAWYVYTVGQPVPTKACESQRLLTFIDEIDRLLRSEHAEDYCGIVYADDMTCPRFIKIYDPNNLGVTCGFSDNPPLPGWIVCRQRPYSLEKVVSLPANHRRWWQRIFG